jgi:hypothetical protein
MIANTPAYQETVEILISFPGLGRVTSAALVADCPELGSLNRRKIGTLTGTAPLNDDRGRQIREPEKPHALSLQSRYCNKMTPITRG